MIAYDRNNFLNLLNDIHNIRHYVCGVCRGMQVGKIDSELDYLIRFENLDEGFSIVCKQLGIPKTSLPIRNQSIRKHYSKYYDSQLIKIVESKFNEEIKFGDYNFENA